MAKKILIVDDSETLRLQLRHDLEAAGHSVSEAVDGVNGLEVLRRPGGLPDLLFCDVNMPRMDGLVMCEKLREDESLRKVPVIMLTTESNPDIMERSKRAGVIAWIIKPYKKATLLAAIEKVLGRT